MMRIVILRSNPVSPDPRVEKTARALANIAQRVVVLGWDRTAEISSPQALDYGTLELLPIRAPFGRGVGNLPQLVRWQWGLLRWLIQNRNEFDIIHSCDFDTILPSLFIRLLFHRKVVYDIFDFYADHLRNTPVWIKRLIRRVDLWAIGHVDAVILVDESRKAQIKEAKSPRIIVINNTPEDAFFAERVSTREQADERSFRIVYVGLMNVERGLLELLEVIERHPNWRLDLAGFGGDESIICSRAHEIQNVRFHGRIQYQQAISLMGSADVFVALYDPGIANHRFASPNKLFEAMMLGKPIIVASGTSMDRIVQQEGCGMIVQYGDVDALEEALTDLARDEFLRFQLGDAGRYAYKHKYHWNLMRERLINLYQELASSRA
jgi:glycosyltransferase involved in cell wall biosynthesis